MPHTYHLSLTHLSDQRGNPVGSKVCDFEFKNHDDLGAIIKLTREGGVVPGAETLEFAIGLKLLAEVAMKHRAEPAFVEFWPHLGNFVRAIKRSKSQGQP